MECFVGLPGGGDLSPGAHYFRAQTADSRHPAESPSLKFGIVRVPESLPSESQQSRGWQQAQAGHNNLR
jgi:hypothetical protein